MPRVLLLVLAALLLLACGGAEPPVLEPSPQPPPGPVALVSPQPLAVGARVAARWTDGAFYPGRVEAADGGRFSIAFDDGDRRVVGPRDVLPMVAPGSLARGERVLAVWRDGKMYPGEVMDVVAGRATIRWDDGDAPLAVPEANVARLDATNAVAAPAAPAAPPLAAYPGLAVGTPVAALWKDGNYWLGQIAAAPPAGGYRIHYADGDVLDVRDDQVIPCGGAHQVGDHVMAHWKNARMYPGKITAIQGNLATVQWDDGDTPRAVPLDQVAPY